MTESQNGVSATAGTAVTPVISVNFSRIDSHAGLGTYGGATTLTDGSIYRGNGGPGGPQDALRDNDAKKPGAAANVTDVPVPKPPIADSSDPRRQ